MDSGRSLTIDVTNVKKILNKFLILPFQAIECSLHKLSCPKSNNNNNVWPQKSAGKFLEMVQNASALKAKIMSKEGIKPEILVYVKIDQLTGSKQTADRKWINVGEELVRLGLASESCPIGNTVVLHVHTSLKFRKKCKYKSAKKHYLPLHKWQKIIFLHQKKV